MQTKNASFLPSMVLAVLIAPVAPAAPASLDDAFIVQQSATIRGKLDGSLQVLADGGTVQIGNGASVAGDLLVPPEKTPPNRGGGQSEPPAEANPSSAFKIDNPGGVANLKGAVRAAAAFTLPPVVYSAGRIGKRSVVVTNGGETVDFKDLGNLTLRHPKALAVVPAGSYGDFSVEQGTLILGFGSRLEPLRYEFQKLDVGTAGRILVAGPVVVTLADGAIWNGSLGDQANPFWLDARVGAGDVTLGTNATFNGFLSAPRSVVAIGEAAVFRGELAAVQVAIADKATVSVISPHWTAAKGDGTGPAFSHRALHLQRALPDLQQCIRGKASAAVAYPRDSPFVMISSRRAANDGTQAANDEAALFEAFCTLFGDTGFERAGVVLIGPASSAAAPSAGVRNIILTAAQFDDVLKELGGTSSADTNIQTIRSSPDLLGRFMSRAVALSTTSAGSR